MPSFPHLSGKSFQIPNWPYNPKGLLALAFFAVPLPPIPPPTLDKPLMAPAPLVLNPSGFPFVGARVPCAPDMSLSEFPYSRTVSPQVRDVFAIETAAPLPAPATPFPAAITTALAALPIPEAAALAVLLMPEDAAPRPFVSQLWGWADCWDANVLGRVGFLWATGLELGVLSGLEAGVGL